MSNEIRVQASLQVTGPNNVQYNSRPTAFNADRLGSAGPTPGTILVSTSGTKIDLSQLTNPGGWCRIANLDLVNTVEIGTFDPGSNKFTPMCELWKGEFFPLRLSRYLGSDIGTGVGTGATATGIQLWIKAIAASCQVLVEAFDS